MSLFLFDKGVSYNYDQFVGEISSAKSYYPLYKYDKIYDFFKNLVVALVGSHNLILLDSDINSSEIEGIDDNLVNNEISINPVVLTSIKDVVEGVQKSKSEITIFTSGTTGQPKKVIHTVATLTRSTRVDEKYKDNIWAFCYNPTHMAGLQVFFQAFENCNPLINLFNAGRNEVYDSIEKHRINHISATPTFYRLLLPFEKRLESVRRVTFGGEKSDSKLYESIKEIFPNAKINNIYASTEAGSLFAAKGEYFQLPPNMFEKFKVVDGELLIHKSMLGRSDSFTFSGDYYHTGDIIEWVNESEKIFKFASRKNLMINVGGYKVNPEEVEAEIFRIEGVREVMVYGKVNSILGNILCADIELEKNNSLTEEDIRHYLNGKIQDFKIPRRIKFVDEIALTRTGKLKRL